MDTSNWRRGGVDVAVGNSSLQSGDWRAQLQAAARERMVNRILVTVKRHLPCYGPEGLQELRKISERFEEKIFNGATSRSDYLRRISLKMLTIDTRPRRPMPMQSNSGANSVNPSN